MHKIKEITDEINEGKNWLSIREKKAYAVACRLNELISHSVETDDHIDLRELDMWLGMVTGAAAQFLWHKIRIQN
jgi:hypothetical protein